MTNQRITTRCAYNFPVSFLKLQDSIAHPPVDEKKISKSQVIQARKICKAKSIASPKTNEVSTSAPQLLKKSAESEPIPAAVINL